MNSRIARLTLHVLCAVLVLGLSVLVDPTPAQAIDPFGCAPEAPEPASPLSGVSALFLTEPASPPASTGPTASVYDVYGYSGFEFSTYDLGCGADARDPTATVTTGLASFILSGAATVVAISNSLRDWAYDPGSAWGWSDGFVQGTTEALRDRLFTPWGALAVAAVGLYLLWTTRRGDWSDVALTVGWAVFVVVLTSAVVSWPVRASHLADQALTQTVGTVHSAVNGLGPNDDPRPPSDRVSGTLTDALLYQQWLQGTFGSSQTPLAQEYGPKVFSSQTISWAEQKEVGNDAKKRDALVKAKKDAYKKYAAEIKDRDGYAYQHMQGKSGWNRVWVASIALISSILTLPFDLAASLMIIVAFLVIRLAVVFLPAIATVGIFRPASGPLRRLFAVLVAAMVNTLLFTAGSLAFVLAVEVITGTASLAPWQRLLLIALTGLVLWLLIRPYRRFTEFMHWSPLRTATDTLKKAGRSVGRVAEETAALRFRDKLAAKDGAQGLGNSRRPENWSRPVVVVVGVTVNVGAEPGLADGAADGVAGSGRVDEGPEIVDAEVVDAGAQRDSSGGRLPLALPAGVPTVRSAPPPLRRAGRIVPGREAAPVTFRPDHGATESGDHAGVRNSHAITVGGGDAQVAVSLGVHESHRTNDNGLDVFYAWRPGQGVVAYDADGDVVRERREP
jgi:uncharacterized membrane protein